MIEIRDTGAALAAAFLLGACSYGTGGLWSPPPDTAPTPAAATAPPIETAEVAAAAPPPAAAGAPVLPASRPSPLGIAPDPGRPETGTAAGRRIATQRGELEDLKARIVAQNGEFQALANDAVSASQRHAAAVADIDAHIQAGTSPANPTLVERLRAAAQELDGIEADTARLSALAEEIGANGEQANALALSTGTIHGLPGAVDEDRRRLAAIEDELGRLMISNQRLLTRIKRTIGRNGDYLSGERRRLDSLSVAVRSGRAALVTIRFDAPDVDYEMALYEAVSAALNHRPDARFELVAVTPPGAAADMTAVIGTAKRNVGRVMRSLATMGLPEDRMLLLSEPAGTARSNEVRIFLR